MGTIQHPTILAARLALGLLSGCLGRCRAAGAVGSGTVVMPATALVPVVLLKLLCRRRRKAWTTRTPPAGEQAPSKVTTDSGPFSTTSERQQQRGLAVLCIVSSITRHLPVGVRTRDREYGGMARGYEEAGRARGGAAG